MERFELTDFIRRFTQTSEAGRDGAIVHRGTSGPYDGPMLACLVPEGFVEVKEWRDGLHRRVWRDDEALATITYVEGDVHVALYPSRPVYEEGLRRQAAFYENH